MKIYFNSLGVVSSIDTTDESIRQGSVGNTIYAYFDGISNVNYLAKINFVRPDGTRLDNIVMSADESTTNLYTLTLDDVWYLAISGNASISIYLYDSNNNIVANGAVQFVIESTDYNEDADTITEAQFNRILAAIAEATEKIGEIRQYVDDNYVPYSGATNNVHLGGYSLDSDEAIRVNGIGSDIALTFVDYHPVLSIHGGDTILYLPEQTNEAWLATEEYVNYVATTLKSDAFKEVNTTTYPTLDDFLNSTGVEGNIYLYPIDINDSTAGYYRYIWENSEWLSLGTTKIDLSDYVKKTTTIAGLDLEDNITSAELLTALGLSFTDETITEVD